MTVYISSLPAGVTYDQLFRDAEQFGETMSVKLDSSPSATSRAYVMSALASLSFTQS